MDYTVHGILQVRILEWVAILFSRGSSQPRDRTQVSNPGLLHCRWILYQLSRKGSPRILEGITYPVARGSSQPRNRTRVSCIADNLSDTLKKLKITAADRTDDSLEGCLDCLLQALTQNNMETSEKIQGSGILQVFASLLIPQSSCTAKVANVIAEIAKNGEVFLKNFSAGNIFSFTPYLIYANSMCGCWIDFTTGAAAK
uniref:Rap1 GTPase-GDP dissociation stimulator 1 n=1 Tax=Ovis aries TaxID=9940 RepID=A0AC11CZI7_SHEEP